MTGRSTAVDTLVAEIAAVATMPGSITSRAEALLEPLGKLVSFDAAQITLLDPERHAQPALVRCGFPERVQKYMDGTAFVEDLELIGLHKARRPMRAMDMPMPEVPLWVEYLQPAGFGEGLGVPLVTADDRYLGQLAMLTETTTPVSDATCEALAALAPLIARAVDPLRAVGVLASLVNEAVAAVLLTRAGNTTPLPGLPDHGLLAPDGPVLREAAACLRAGHTYGAFLTPEHAPGHPHRYLKATFLACPALPPGHVRAAVLLCSPGDLHALTDRELCIVGMLVAGWSRRRIVAGVQLPRRAVTAALEAIRIKLSAPTCGAAVLRAADQGLYLPPSLAETPR